VNRPFVYEAERLTVFFRRGLQFRLRLERPARRAEPALVKILVDVLASLRRPPRGGATPEHLRALVMKRLGRAHEDVVAAVLAVESERAEHFFEFADDEINVLLRRAARARRRALDVRPVLVRARQEESLVAALPPVPRQKVRDD